VRPGAGHENYLSADGVFSRTPGLPPLGIDEFHAGVFRVPAGSPDHWPLVNAVAFGISSARRMVVTLSALSWARSSALRRMSARARATTARGIAGCKEKAADRAAARDCARLHVRVIAAPMPSPETDSKPRSEVQTLDSLARLASQCRQRRRAVRSLAQAIARAAHPGGQDGVGPLVSRHKLSKYWCTTAPEFCERSSAIFCAVDR
jgi:hypothetical protein